MAHFLEIGPDKYVDIEQIEVVAQDDDDHPMVVMRSGYWTIARYYSTSGSLLETVQELRLGEMEVRNG